MGHIAIFLTTMHVGGAERIALNLSTGFLRKGHTVDLVLVNAEGALLKELPESATVVNLSASRVMTSIIPLRQYLRERNPDVLYSMMTEINIASIIAHRLSGVDTRLVISEHNTPSVSAEGVKDKFVLQLSSLTYPRADHVVTVSHGVRDDLLNVIDLAHEKTTVIHNPIDVERIRKQASESVEHGWLTDQSIPVVMSAGRHVPQKGFDTLLRAFARLEDPNVRLILLGKGEETEALRKLASKLEIEDRVDFLGFVENPFKYMATADVFVLSSWYEGFGNVLIEAMATGCPVVSTDCRSGPREILDGGAYGPLVPVKEPAPMSDAIENTLDNPEEETVLSDRTDNFSIEKVTEKYERVLF